MFYETSMGRILEIYKLVDPGTITQGPAAVGLVSGRGCTGGNGTFANWDNGERHIYVKVFVYADKCCHYIDILEPNGDLLVRHKRQYGDIRTDISDYSTSLEMLSKNIGAWDNSGFRKDAPELIREYIDSQPRAERKSCVRLLSELTKEYGYAAAVRALELAIKAGSVNRSDAAILAARITGYGIDTPPEPGPSLAIYDQVFLPSKDNGKEALAS